MRMVSISSVLGWFAASCSVALATCSLLRFVPSNNNMLEFPNSIQHEKLTPPGQAVIQSI